MKRLSGIGCAALCVAIACCLLGCSAAEQNASEQEGTPPTSNEPTSEGYKTVEFSGISFEIPDSWDVDDGLGACDFDEDGNADRIMASTSYPITKTADYSDYGGSDDSETNLDSTLDVRVNVYQNGETKDLETFSGRRNGIIDEMRVTISCKDLELKNERSDNGVSYKYYSKLEDSALIEDGRLEGVVLGYDEGTGKGFTLSITKNPYDSDDDDPIIDSLLQSITFDRDAATVDTALAADKAKNPSQAEDASQAAPEETSSGSTADTDESKKDKTLVEEDGKTMYQVYALDDTIHFKGSYSGSGNFIVRILDSNQDLYALAANEIGSYVLDKSVDVTQGSMYYVVIEYNNGSWDMSWTGTYGN